MDDLMVYISVRNYVEHTEEGPSFMPSLHVDGRGTIYTGLFDIYGNDICRVQDPIGFDIERPTRG